MELCTFCQRSFPIYDQGVLILRTDHESLADNYQKIFAAYQHKSFSAEQQALLLTYHTIEELRTYMAKISESLTDEEMSKAAGNIIGMKDEKTSLYPAYPLRELILRTEYPAYTEIIQNRLFQSHMQPIVSTKDTSVYGYEFLLRPVKESYPFSPADLFDFSTKSGMQSMLDSQARISAIQKASAELDDNELVFINFLPSTIYNPAFCLKTTFEAIEKYPVKPENLIFEVVETEKIADFNHLKSIFTEYKRRGVKVALDDIGSGFATIDVLNDLKPDYAKIDRELIRDCHLSGSKQKRIKEIAATAEDIGTKVLAEGIETQDEFETVKAYADLAQGYFFGKPAASPVS